MNTHTRKPIGQRLLSAITLIAVVLGMTSFASPRASLAAPTADQTLTGSAVEGNLQITVRDTGTMGVWRYVSGVWQQQIFGLWAKGSRLQFSGGAYTLSKESTWVMNGADPTLVSNSTSGNTITTVWNAGSNFQITQKTTYNDNTSYYRIEWNITNTSGAAINDLRFFHGEDTFLQGGDSGAGWWDAVNTTVGVQKNIGGVLQRMYLQGITTPFGYNSINYSQARTNANNGALTNTVDPNEGTDNGYALEWRNASLAAGDTWTIVAFERFTSGAAGSVYVIAPVSADCNVGSSCDVTYQVSNPSGAAVEVNLSVAGDQPTWNAAITSPTNPATVPANGAISVVVRVSPPAGTAIGTIGNFTLTATPTGGGSAASDTAAVRAIITAPAAPTITSPVTGTVTNDNTPTFSGTAEAGTVTVTVSLQGGGAVCVATVQPDNSWSCTPSARPDGEHTFVAVADDGTGNVSDPSAPVTITIDTVAPGAPTVTAPVSGTVTSDDTPTFEGTGEPGGTVTVYDDEGGVVCAATVNPDGSWSCTPSTPLDNGEQTFEVTVTDPAGNESDPTPVIVTIAEADIDISVTELTSTQPPDVVTTQTFEICNNGTLPLTYTISAGSLVGPLMAQFRPFGITAPAAPAQPTTVTINETFMNDTAPGWLIQGHASLTSGSADPTGQGWLRLTSAAGNQAGSAIYNTAFSSNDGINVTFQYATYGGSGADGITFYLIDGATALPTVGAPGGSLGYSYNTDSPVAPGVTNGYVGIGFDEYGNFSNARYGACNPSCPGRQANRVAVRGSGTLNSGFNFLTNAPAAIQTGNRAGAHTVKIEIVDQKITVRMDSGSGFVTLIDQYDLLTAIGQQTPTPYTFKMGFSASTGGSTNYHEIRNLEVVSVKESSTTVLDAAPNPIKLGRTIRFVATVSGGSGTPTGEVTFLNGNTVLGTGALVGGVATFGTSGLPSGTHVITARYEGDANFGISLDDVTVEVLDTFPMSVEPESGTVAPGACDTITVTFDSTGLTDGVYTGELVIDSNDPDSPATIPVTLTVPDVAPLTVIAPISGTTTSDIPTFAGTGEPGYEVNVYDDEGNVVCTAVVGFDGFWTYVPDVPLEDGEQTFEVTQTNPWGGESDPVEVTIIVVTTPAVITPPIILSPADGDLTNDNTPTFEGVADAGTTVTVTLEDGAFVCAATVDAKGLWSCTPGAPLPDGEHTFVAVSGDGAGNESDPSGPVTITIDTVAPAPPTVTAPISGTVTSDTPTFAGTGEPGHDITVYDDGGNVVCTSVVDPDGNWTCVPDAPLEDGEQTFDVTQKDPAGNESDPVKITITVDTSPAVITPPIITAPISGAVTNDNTPTFEGIADAGTTVTVTLEDGTFVCAATVDAKGLWSCTPGASLPDGEHTFVAVSGDGAGNESDPSGPVTITIDTVAPEAPVIITPSEGATTGPLPTFTGTAEPGTTVRVEEMVGTLVVVICEAVTDAAGNWTCTATTPLTAGEHTATAIAVDEAGNESGPDEVTFTVAPVDAQDDTYDVPEGIGSALDVLANDSSASGGDLTIVAVGAPAHGTATTDGATIVYTPTAGYLGEDSFAYTINDGVSEDNGQVTVTVLPVADLAVAQTVRGTISGLEFILVARNLGPRSASGAVISDTFPPSLGNITWTCTAAGGAACPNASGANHIEETLATFPSGGVVTYTVAANIVVSTIENNTVTITPPAGTFDLVLSNNSATRPTLYRIILPLVYRNATP